MLFRRSLVLLLILGWFAGCEKKDEGLEARRLQLLSEENTRLVALVNRDAPGKAQATTLAKGLAMTRR